VECFKIFSYSSPALPFSFPLPIPSLSPSPSPPSSPSPLLPLPPPPPSPFLPSSPSPPPRPSALSLSVPVPSSPLSRRCVQLGQSLAAPQLCPCPLLCPHAPLPPSPLSCVPVCFHILPPLAGACSWAEPGVSGGADGQEERKAPQVQRSLGAVEEGCLALEHERNLAAAAKSSPRGPRTRCPGTPRAEWWQGMTRGMTRGHIAISSQGQVFPGWDIGGNLALLQPSKAAQEDLALAGPQGAPPWSGVRKV